MLNWITTARPEPLQIPFSIWYILFAGLILLASAYGAKLVAEHCAQRWNNNPAKANLICIGIMCAVTTASLIIFGISMTTLQASIYCGTCLFASYSDFKERKLDDCASCIVFVTALIGCTMTNIPAMVISGLVIGGVTLITATISGGKGIGGADIKFAAASATMLGLHRSCIGLIVGLLLAVIINGIRDKRRGTKDGFPLIPYMAIGFVGAFFIP